MSQARRGVRVEILVADELGARGYDVIRSAGSKGAADLVAVHDAEILFVQVKIGKPGQRVFMSPSERRELVRIADRMHPRGVPVAAVRTPGSGPRPAVLAWYILTGTGPYDYEEWVPRDSRNEVLRLPVTV